LEAELLSTTGSGGVPDLLLPRVDTWALGCVMAELLTGMGDIPGLLLRVDMWALGCVMAELPASTGGVLGLLLPRVDTWALGCVMAELPAGTDGVPFFFRESAVFRCKFPL
jgi:hypothetical protein